MACLVSGKEHENHFCNNCRYANITALYTPISPCYACGFAMENKVEKVCNWEEKEEEKGD